MPRSDKTDAADRARGGPGSEQNSRRPRPAERTAVQPDQPTNPNRSRVSGGGGERDRHHSHDPTRK